MFLYCKFYRSLRFIHEVISEGRDIEKYLITTITNITYFFRGGVDYFRLKETNLYEIVLLHVELSRINKELKDQVKG